MSKSAPSPARRIDKIRAMRDNLRLWLRWHLPVSYGTACEIAEREDETGYQALSLRIDDLRDIYMALVRVPDEEPGPAPAPAARRHGMRAV